VLLHKLLRNVAAPIHGDSSGNQDKRQRGIPPHCIFYLYRAWKLTGRQGAQHG
jgi:hypothetical protein